MELVLLLFLLYVYLDGRKKTMVEYYWLLNETRDLDCLCLYLSILSR
jgi:hypothetical protein